MCRDGLSGPHSCSEGEQGGTLRVRHLEAVSVHLKAQFRKPEKLLDVDLTPMDAAHMMQRTFFTGVLALTLSDSQSAACHIKTLPRCHLAETRTVV